LAIGDFTILENSSTSARGSRTYNVAAAATAILPGEPVVRSLGAATVTRLYGTGTTGTNAPAVGTDYVVGIAMTTSTQTASAAGTVEVMPLNSATTWLANPLVAATWDTQSEYDALVGDRELVDLTSGAYSIIAGDSANNGLIVMPLDVSKYPGKIAVAFRGALSDVQ
jgi:hypothetical protein